MNFCNYSVASGGYADERRPCRAGRVRPLEIAGRSAGNLLPVPWIEAEDVAHLVAFLASGRARYATGSRFVLDAGLLSL